MAPIGEGRPQVLAVGAAGIDDRVRARSDGPAAEHGGLVTPRREPEGEAVDEDL